MEISKELKANLIADVENICGMSLKGELKEDLKRAFEITIGVNNLKKEPHIHINTALLLIRSTTDESAIQQMKSSLSGVPETAEIDGELVVSLVRKKKNKIVSKTICPYCGDDHTGGIYGECIIRCPNCGRTFVNN